MMASDLPRIAFVVSELRPGGMERVVVHLAVEMSERGYSVMVVCLQSPGVLSALLVGKGISVVALGSDSGKDVKALYALSRELKRFRPTVIHLHDYASLPYVALANLFAGRCQLLFTAHGLLYDGFEHLQKRLHFFSRFLTAISAVSEKVANRHRDYLRWEKEITFIDNGVPKVVAGKGDRRRIRQELGCTDDTCLFLAVGNPRPEKAFEDLLDAVNLIRCNHDNFFVAIAGTLTESTYCQDLLQQLQRLGLEGRCRFLGFREDTVALYSAADCFVLSSHSEGLPMVILEAMMAGLPVIATRVGGIPDAVGDNVLLVDASQPEQLADTMAHIMCNDSLRIKLAARGTLHVEKNFGVERMVDEYVNWYGRSMSDEC